MKIVGILSALALTACIDTELDLEAEPRLSANALLPEELLATPLDPGVLNQANLDAMAATAEGRVTMRYLFGCALAQGTSVVANYIDDAGNPQTRTYGGAMGLASTWTSQPLTVAQQRLVTACTASLTNKTGANVTISQRGPHGALATTSAELAGYQLQEGAFFGNMFFGGEGIVACSGTGTSTAPGRVCTAAAGRGTTECGYTHAGACATTCTFSSSSGYFSSCSFNGIGYTQPVSTYLAN